MAEEFKGRKVGGGQVAEVDGAYFGGTCIPPIWRNIAVDRRNWPTSPANVNRLSSSGNAMATHFPRCSFRKVRRWHGLSPVSPSAPSLTRRSVRLERAAIQIRNEAHRP